MPSNKPLLYVAFVLIGLISIAQDSVFVPNVILDEDAERVDILQLSDQLNRLRRRSVDLNTTNRTELHNLGVLSEVQIAAILEHLVTYGNFLEVGELKSLGVFSDEDFDRISPLFMVSRIQIEDIDHTPRLNLMIRSSTDDSPVDGSLGSNYQHLLRLRYYAGKIDFGFITEKDKGEKFYTEQGLDYWSGFINYQDDKAKIVKQVVLGNYSLSFARGLVFGSTYYFGKGINATAVENQAVSVRPYSSVYEEGALSGVVTQLQVGRLKIIPFYSQRKRDATVNDDGSLGAFQLDGLHTSENALAKKDVVSEEVIGTRAVYGNNHFSLGFNYVNFSYDKTLNKSQNLANTFDFRGDAYQVLSTDFDFYMSNATIFGELSYLHRKLNILSGIKVFSSNRELVLLYRNYHPSNDLPYSNSFSERSTNKNEEGIYFGFRNALGSKFLFNAYYDVFSYPWVTTTLKSSQKGDDLMLNLDWFTTDKVTTTFRYKQEHKLDDDEIGLITQTDRRYRITSDIEVSRQLSLKTVVEHHNVQSTELSKGWLIAQRFSKYLKGLHTTITVGGIFFRSDDFASGVYNYENDVLYAFTVPKYFGSGYRFYLVGRSRLSKSLRLEYKIGRLLRDDLRSTDVKFQLIGEF